MSEFNSDIRKLADLLKTDHESSESEDDLPGMSKIGEIQIFWYSSHIPLH